MKNKGIISLLAILVLVLGGVAYLFTTNKLENPKIFETELQKYEEVSNTDEVEDIETDLENTEVNDIDKEIPQIDAEIDASY